MAITKEQLAQRVEELQRDLENSLQDISDLEAQLRAGTSVQLEAQLDEKTDDSARFRGGINVLEEMINQMDQ